ncbi:hypothetical protein SAMN05444583_106213 [Rhodococcus maanshanensis]|uniref:Uncharacterized protein n=1 Tax=Rhodococcus maanshanensis TaxID=183556 RepID=A0A1H7N2K5_9NOCA|nr:hypothetical protein SAMN05444583_106213 [Rhodococcus maanshanensis]
MEALINILYAVAANIYDSVSGSSGSAAPQEPQNP